jgi:transposase
VRRSKTYDKEFRISAIQLCFSSKSITQVAYDLGIPKTTLKGWVKTYKDQGENGFLGSGNTKPANEELHQLRKELEDVKLERDILKKAVAIFSKQK